MFDRDRAEKLDALLDIAEQTNDRDLEVKVLREMQAMKSQLNADISSKKPKDTFTVPEKIPFKTGGSAATSAPMPANPVTDIAGMVGKVATAAGGKLAELKTASDLETEAKIRALEQSNPALAAQISEMSPLERFGVGYGMGTNDVMRGTGVADTAAGRMVDANPDDTSVTDKSLTDTSGAASAGQILGQAMPFVAAGLGLSKIPGPVLRTAASGLLGGAEGAIISAGTGQSGQEQVKNSLVGAGIGIAAEAIPIIGPAIAAFVSRRLGRPVEPEQLVQPTGDLTPEFSQFLNEQRLDPAAVIAQAQSEAGVARSFAEAAPRTPDQLEAMNGLDIPAAMAAVDPQAIQNYVDAGIDIADIPLAAVTRDVRVRELSAQLSAIGGSEARAQAIRLADAVRNTARQTIEEAGGSMEVGKFSENTLNSMRAARETIYQAENAAYTMLGQKIDQKLASLPGVAVRAPQLKSQLIEKAKKLRETGLSKVEAKTLKIISGKPSYQDIDNLRRDIGGSIGAMPRGLYANQDQATLKNLYGQLQEAQNKFARGLVGGDDLKMAQEISKQRHALQDQIEFFGQNDGLGSMVAKLNQVAGGANRVDYAQFDRVMENIPEQYRKGALATIMNQSLKISPDIGADKMAAGNFANMWSNIRGDSALNSRVRTVLGNDSYQAFDKLAGMAQGVSRALGGKQTGIAREVLRDFYKPSGVIGKLTKAMRMGGVATGTPGAGAAATVVDGVTALAQAGNSDAAGNVTMMISSPTFMKAAIEAARNPTSADAKALSAQLMKTKAANKFMDAATADARKQIIAAGGIPIWLMTKDDEENK